MGIPVFEQNDKTADDPVSGVKKTPTETPRYEQAMSRVLRYREIMRGALEDPFMNTEVVQDTVGDAASHIGMIEWTIKNEIRKFKELLHGATYERIASVNNAADVDVVLSQTYIEFINWVMVGFRIELEDLEYRENREPGDPERQKKITLLKGDVYDCQQKILHAKKGMLESGEMLPEDQKSAELAEVETEIMELNQRIKDLVAERRESWSTETKSVSPNEEPQGEEEISGRLSIEFEELAEKCFYRLYGSDDVTPASLSIDVIMRPLSDLDKDCPLFNALKYLYQEIQRLVEQWEETLMDVPESISINEYEGMVQRVKAGFDQIKKINAQIASNNEQITELQEKFLQALYKNRIGKLVEDNADLVHKMSQIILQLAVLLGYKDGPIKDPTDNPLSDDEKELERNHVEQEFVQLLEEVIVLRKMKEDERAKATTKLLMLFGNRFEEINRIMSHIMSSIKGSAKQCDQYAARFAELASQYQEMYRMYMNNGGNGVNFNDDSDFYHEIIMEGLPANIFDMKRCELPVYQSKYSESGKRKKKST
jgi:uncharacterized protein YoxC/uncharacterized membrane protein